MLTNKTLGISEEEAAQLTEYYSYIDNELDKLRTSENNPNTKWYSNEEVKEMLGLGLSIKERGIPC